MERKNVIGGMMAGLSGLLGGASKEFLDNLGKVKGPSMAHRDYAVGGRKGRHRCATNARATRRKAKAKRRHG